MLVALVPAYNEEKKIGSVVRGLFRHVDSVIVIDDGSRDATSEVARAAGATVLRHEINRGQGAALQTGQAYALSIGAEYILHFDGDGQFDPEDIAPAVADLKKKNSDILFGSRFLDTRSHIPWTKRTLILPIGRLINRLFTRITLSDAHNGFRLLTARAAQCIAITQDRMAHATEILALVKKHGLRYSEFPVKVQYAEYGQGAVGGLHVLKDLFLGKFIR